MNIIVIVGKFRTNIHRLVLTCLTFHMKQALTRYGKPLCGSAENHADVPNR